MRLNTKTSRHDPSRERLNKILTWKIMGSLTFTYPVPEEGKKEVRYISESKRVKMFLEVVRQLERRYKMPMGELRWVLKEEGDFINKLFHFHFLLDGSNMPNKDAATVAVVFGRLWEKNGGGNHEVEPYTIQRDPDGYQRGVNYVTKLEGLRVPFSKFFNAGEDCHLRFSESLDRHLAAVCSADQKPNQKD